MAMKTITRRQVLRGLGGFTLALPLLPSLLGEREAHAAGGPRRFIALRSEHGGLLGSNMYPDDAALTELRAYAGHDVRRGDLSLSVAGGTASLSPVLSAPSDRLTARIAGKMNVLRGLDLPFYIAHHGGGSLGNYGDSTERPKELRPTCDQVLAWSPKFYRDLSTIKARSMVIGSREASWGYANPEDPQRSAVEPLHSEYSSRALFQQIYAPSEAPAEQRPPLVDRVLEDYKRLRNGDRRLSSLDRRRLDDHIARLDELDRKLNVRTSCEGIEPPGKDSVSYYSDTFFRDPAAHGAFWSLINDVIVAALACDTSRIVTLRAGDMWAPGGDTGQPAGWFSDTDLDWHQEVAHRSHEPARQAVLREAHRGFFEKVFLDLVAKLDAVELPEGGTLLDDSLVFWTQESGAYTHDPIAMPVVTAGSAGGYLRTGSYADYRDLDVVCHTGKDDPAGEVTHAGLLYNQFLGTAMQAMGLAPEDYESVPGGGYGLHFESTDSWFAGHGKHSAAVRRAAGDVLPFLKA